MCRARQSIIAARLVATMTVAVVASACNGVIGEPDPPSTTAPSGSGDPTDEVLIAPYANSGWPTQHADSANDRHVPTALGDSYELGWSSLGSAVVLSSPIVGADGRILVTTALGPGHSNLHAFDAAGSVLWETEPWEPGPEAAGVDSCAGLFSPVADDEGDVYLTDCDQLWAFYPSGDLKWVIDLPAAPARSPYQEDTRQVPFNPLSGLMIQPAGELVGLTVFGQVIIVDRDDGEELVAPFTLPALPGGEVDVALQTPALWSGRDIDPDVIDPALQMLSGGVFPNPNPPAQDADGTVYVVARSDVSAEWMVYTLRIDRSESGEGSVFVNWSQTLGAAPASAPALSEDRSLLFVADRAGTVRAVDTESGVLRWTVEAGATGSPVAVSPDGPVLVATTTGDVVALADDGAVEWTSTVAAETASIYGTVDGLGGPTVQVVGSPVVTDHSVVLSLEVSYALGDDDGGDDVASRVPVHGEIVSLDAVDGARTSILATRRGDGNGQVTMSTINGVLVAPNSCARSTSSSTAFEEVAFRVRFAGYAVDDFTCGVDVFRPTDRPAATG